MPSVQGTGNKYDQGAVAVLCDWEGKRRSVVAPAMRHKLCGISTYGLNGIRKGDEHPAYTPVRIMAPFTFISGSLKWKKCETWRFHSQMRLYHVNRARHKANIHCVSKNVPHMVCYNFDIRERILIFFGRNVTYKVSNQKTMPRQITYASALPDKRRNTKIAFFHSNDVSVHCRNSTSRFLISSVFLTHDSYSCCCMTP